MCLASSCIYLSCLGKHALFQATQNIFLFTNVFKTYFLSTEDGTDCSFVDASIDKCL